MVLLIYSFVIAGGQLMFGMAEFDTYERCQREGIPRAEAEYPGAGAACVIVRPPG